MEQASQKHTKRNIIIAVLVGLLGLCIICLVAAALMPKGEKLAGSDTVKIDATAVFKSALETASAQVTPQRLEPTTTQPVPTATAQQAPEPTATKIILPQKTTDPSVIIYTTVLQDKLVHCKDGLTTMGDKSTEVSKNTALLFDSNWKFQMAAALVTMKQYCTTFSEITPVPTSLQTSHNFLVLAEQQYKIVVQNMVEGIDEINADKITIANNALDQANTYIITATAALPQE